MYSLDSVVVTVLFVHVPPPLAHEPVVAPAMPGSMYDVSPYFTLADVADVLFVKRGLIGTAFHLAAPSAMAVLTLACGVNKPYANVSAVVEKRHAGDSYVYA